MIAGIGGASLGTELMKCLLLGGRYEIFGCDVSKSAFGLYDASFSSTYLVDRDNDVPSVVAACRESSATWVLPGGEQPLMLLSGAHDVLKRNGLVLIANSPEIIRTYSNKSETFTALQQLCVPSPRTVQATSPAAIASVGLPCIIKPATGSGGSAMVFFAEDQQEAQNYAHYIHRTGGMPIAQEYIGHAEGEFTVGVLSLPDARVVGSVDR